MENSLGQVNEYAIWAWDLVKLYGLKVLLAVLFLVIGLWLIGVLVNWAFRIMEKREVNPSLRPFIRTLMNWTLKILLFISAASMIGIETTSFVAVLGAASLAIGLALQGSLSNFAGGVLILLLKPFQVGDWIDGSGQSGSVNEIQIFYTILKTADNKTIIIPNGKLSNDVVVNYSMEPLRRLDLIFGIGYDDDIIKAKEILREIVDSEGRIKQDPEPQIMVKDLGESSVNLTARLWVEKDNYWPLNWALQERVKLAFDEAGITIPFPQRDLHIFKHES